MLILGKNLITMKPIFNEEKFKNENKIHDDEVTDFYDKRIPKVDSQSYLFNCN